tara:strand:+ start:1186 stop:1809 length:624 start_codon:yes stop_codon:yes gene_type:complete
MDEVRIARLERGDARGRFEECARIHAEVIPGGFLVRLGRRFLSALYRHLAGSRHAFLIAALRREEVVGFIVGCEDTRRLYREFLLRNPFPVACAMAGLVFSPSAWKRVYETWRYPSQKLEVELPGNEILNFCVATKCQGKGVGGILFDALCEEFQQREVKEVRIVTGGEQESAHRFYEAKGALLAGEITVHSGAVSRVYVHRLAGGE